MKKFLFDLFPVILFFAVFRWAEKHTDTTFAFVTQYLSAFMASGTLTPQQTPIIVATAVAILATFVQLAYVLARGRKVEPMLWVSLGIITVFGGATIYFNNETFIKWKPTVLYWCFSAALIVSDFALRKNLMKAMLGQQITLPEVVWRQLNLAWAGFFAVMGLVNLYVAYEYDTATWVSFKLFGFTGLMIAFVVAQSVFLTKHLKEAEEG